MCPYTNSAPLKYKSNFEYAKKICFDHSISVTTKLEAGDESEMHTFLKSILDNHIEKFLSTY